jgi:hypothetical protein
MQKQQPARPWSSNRPQHLYSRASTADSSAFLTSERICIRGLGLMDHSTRLALEI